MLTFWLAVVWSTALQFVPPDAVRIWPAAPRLTPHTCCVTTAPRLANASCYSRYRGIPTALLTLTVTGRYQLSPNYAEVDHLSKAVQGDTKTLYVAQVYPGDTNTPVILAERRTHIQLQPYRLCRTLIQRHIAWHCTQRIPSPVDRQQMIFQ